VTDREFNEFVFRPIGMIHTPFISNQETPIQPSRSDAIGRFAVFAEVADGLQDIDGLSHITLLYVFHCSSGYALAVTPFLDDRKRGLFATRHPCHLNPLGLSTVRLVERRGNELLSKESTSWTKHPSSTSSRTSWISTSKPRSLPVGMLRVRIRRKSQTKRVRE
jgi:tRNA (adenine37-N6)-methyltransferase